MNQTPEKPDWADPVVRAAHDWRLRLTDPHVTAEDQKAFRAWLAADARHTEAFGRAEVVFDALGTLMREDFDPRLLESSELERSVSPPSRTTSYRLSQNRWISGVAAAIVVSAVALFLASRLPPEVAAPAVYRQTLSTDVGETRTDKMSDGSSITLGSASEVVIAMGPETREVELVAGDILFNVSRDIERPFVVDAGALQVRVLGTIFDVRHNGGVARVAVAKGQVNVSHPIVIANQLSTVSNRVTLSAGQQVMADMKNGLGEARRIAPDSVGAWREARLIYFRAPLSEVISDANRYVAQTVVLDDPANALAAETVSASFDGQNIDNMLTTLAEILPVTIDRDGPSTIIVRPRNEQ